MRPLITHVIICFERLSLKYHVSFYSRYQSNRRSTILHASSYKPEERGRNKRNELVKSNPKVTVSTSRTNRTSHLPRGKKKISPPPQEKKRASNALVATKSREYGQFSSSSMKCLFESKGESKTACINAHELSHFSHAYLDETAPKDSNLSVFSVEDEDKGPNVFFIFNKR